MDDLQGKNINQDDLAHLISQGVLKTHEEQKQNDKEEQEEAELEVELANKNISHLTYIYEEYLTHENFGDVFSINFISFKPMKNLDNFNNIPNKIFFKFSFWDFEEFSTAPAIITKPSELKASYLSTPPALFIFKEKEEGGIQLNEEMKISITYDPSIENYIDYKNFLNYLLLRELFIQIFDYEKQMPYGYIQIPLKNFLRRKKKSILKNFSVNIYDNFTYEKKGEIELCLKSDELKTIKEFNLREQNEKFNIFYSQNQFINYKGNDLNQNLNNTWNRNNKIRSKRKKVVTVPQMNFNQLTQIEKDLYAQKILEFKTKNNIKGDMNENTNETILQKTLNNKSNGYFLDQNLEKRIRVMRFLDTHIDDGKNILVNEKINNNSNSYVTQSMLQKSLKRKQDEQNYYDTLNYTNYIKNINKESLIAKTIAENNKNILSLALIQGEPHYFNFILTNETNHQELYHIIISKNLDKKEKDYEENKHPYYDSNNNAKNENSPNFKDNVVKLVTDPKEFEYATVLKGLKIPNGHDYSYVSKDGHVIVEPHQSIPLLFKCISYRNVQGYDDNVQSKHNIFIYNENNIPQYFLNINIIKVFPIVDFNFYFRVEEKKLSQIKFINPFKYDIMKTQNLISTHHFLNSLDKNSDINLKLDPLNNNFYFNFNNLTNLADNQIKLDSDEAQNLYKTNNVDLSLNSRKRLLFFYKDIYRAQLFSTFNFLINAFECINVCIDLGVKKTFKLFLPEIDSPRTVKLYSSDENILFFQDKYKQNIMVIPNMRYEIEYVVFSKKIANNDILINCIDISNKEVIKTWLVKTAVNQPKVNQVIKVNCLIGNSTQVKFSFTSPLNTWSVLYFESSNRNMVELPVEQMPFNSEENKIITINICKSLVAGRGTAYVFISDSDNLFNQIVQIDIIYY